MAWKYKYPQRREDETEEGYQERVDTYEAMEDVYADEYMERRRDE